MCLWVNVGTNRVAISCHLTKVEGKKKKKVREREKKKKEKKNNPSCVTVAPNLFDSGACSFASQSKAPFAFGFKWVTFLICLSVWITSALNWEMLSPLSLSLLSLRRLCCCYLCVLTVITN